MCSYVAGNGFSAHFGPTIPPNVARCVEVLGFGFKVSGFKLRDTGQQEVPGFELRDAGQQDVGFRVQGIRLRVEGYRATRQRLANHERAVPTKHLFEGSGFRIEG